jgi:hypothetical protein
MSKELEMPDRIAALPRDAKERPVPWFVAWVDGVPDFRVIGPGKIAEAVMEKRCWVCGERLGKYLSFVIGPMCAVNRISSEPASHRDCAIYAAQACPFLTTPKMHRNEKGLPGEVRPAAGIPSVRNPGVTLIWITKGYKILRVDNGVLFQLGEPVGTLWFSEGREATRTEILHSIETGLPSLVELAKLDGPLAVKELERATKEALFLVPR